jgi:hypothetical protein
MPNKYAFAITERFRKAVEDRIVALEHDARRDEKMLPLITCADHRRRHEMLISAQIEEAVRLRTRLSFSNVSAADFTLGAVLAQGRLR